MNDYFAILSFSVFMLLFAAGFIVISIATWYEIIKPLMWQIEDKRYLKRKLGK